MKEKAAVTRGAGTGRNTRNRSALISQLLRYFSKGIQRRVHWASVSGLRLTLSSDRQPLRISRSTLATLLKRLTSTDAPSSAILLKQKQNKQHTGMHTIDIRIVKQYHTLVPEAAKFWLNTAFWMQTL